MPNILDPIKPAKPAKPAKLNPDGYHTSAPAIPNGLVPLAQWAAEHGISANCASRWVYAGKIKVFRVPGYGRRCFILPADGDKAMRPVVSIPRLCQ